MDVFIKLFFSFFYFAVVGLLWGEGVLKKGGGGRRTYMNKEGEMRVDSHLPPFLLRDHFVVFFFLTFFFLTFFFSVSEGRQKKKKKKKKKKLFMTSFIFFFSPINSRQKKKKNKTKPINSLTNTTALHAPPTLPSPPPPPLSLSL